MLTLKNIEQFTELTADLTKIYKQQEEFGALFGWRIDMTIEEIFNRYGGNNLLNVDFTIDSDYASGGADKIYHSTSDTQENYVDRVKAAIYDCAMHVMTNNKQFKEV